MPTEHFDLPITVVPDDIDELGHVNNVVYLHWVQDAAIAHWTAAATSEQRAEVAWVAIRHEIDYKHPAMPGDGIIARTWVGTADSHRFERHTEILRAADGKVLARARTLWCPINRTTGRLTRVGDDVRARFSVAGEGGSHRDRRGTESAEETLTPSLKVQTDSNSSTEGSSP